MSREANLRRHVRGLEVLEQAVQAKKSLSAHHFRLARAALNSARSYRADLEAAVAAVQLSEDHRDAPPLLLVVGADLGLCAQYHARIVEAAIEYREVLGEARVDCIGKRTASLLTRAGISVQRIYGAPSSVEGATRVLLDVVDDLVSAHAAGQIGAVHASSARFLGVGAFEIARHRLLPLPSIVAAGPPPSRYVSAPHLAATVARERLFIALYELLLDAMASEHGARLLSTNGAEDWLSRELARARRLLSSLRRDATTQEILELSTGRRYANR